MLKEIYGQEGAGAYETHRVVDPDVISFFLRYIKNDNFFEAGCGTGNNLLEIYNRTNWRGYGCDKSPRMLEFAAKKDCTRGLWTADLDENLPISWQFDVVFAVDVLHHLNKPESFFRNAYSLLPPQGYLLIGTESEYDLRQKLQATYFPQTLEIDLKRYHTIDRILTLAGRVGFTDQHVKTIAGSEKVTISLIEQYKNKAHSSLALLEEDKFQSGMEQLERDFNSKKLQTRKTSYTLLAFSK